jgi:hypothetical protein
LREEKFISVPEQGGGSLILDGPLHPGVLHTVATGSGGHLGLYRLETQVTSGNSKLTISGLGSNSQAKEAINVGFDYFKANASQSGGAPLAGPLSRQSPHDRSTVIYWGRPSGRLRWPRRMKGSPSPKGT